MPFINSTSFKIGNLSEEPPVVLILDSLLVVSCEDIITLNAETVGGTPQDTYQWVQLTGDPVFWLTDQNQQSVIFQQPNNTRNDKVFRVYIDQNTARQVFGDILVSAIPRDTYQQMSTTKMIGADVDTRRATNYSDLERPVLAVIVPGISPEGTATVLNAERGIEFQFPRDVLTDHTSGIVTTSPRVDNDFVSYDIVDVTGGGYTVVASLTPFERSFFTVAPDRDYQVVAVLNKFNVVHRALGDVAGYYPSDNYLDADTWESSTVNLEVSDLYVASSNFNRTLVEFSMTDDDFVRVSLEDSQQFYAVAAHYPRSLGEQSVTDDDGFKYGLLDGPLYMTKFTLNLGVGTLG